MRNLAFFIFTLILLKAGLCGKKVSKTKNAKHEYKKEFVVGMLPQPVAFDPNYAQMIPRQDGLAPVMESPPRYVPLSEDTPQFLPQQATINPEQPFGAANEESLQYATDNGALQRLPNAAGIGVEQREPLANYLRPGTQRTSDGIARDGSPMYLTGQKDVSTSPFLNRNPIYRINHSGGAMGSNVANARILPYEPNSIFGTGMNTKTLKAITDTAYLDESLKAFNSPTNVQTTNTPHIVANAASVSKLANEANIASQQVKLIEERNKALDAAKEAEYKNTVKNAEMAANLAQTAQTLEKLIQTLHAQRKTFSHHREVPHTPDELNGGWSEWAKWSDCSKTCGAGIKFARRSCNMPRPQDDGEPCRGRRVKVVLCNVDVNCPAPAQPKDDITSNL